MFLFEWFVEVLKELRRVYDDNLSFGGPAKRMGRQLRIMYGRGEIDRATFLKLRNNLEKGYYIEGDLKMYHRQAIFRLEREGKNVEHHANPQIARSLEALYHNRAVLEEIRLEMRQALKTIEITQDWFQKQASAVHESAQQALPDETAARSLLEVRHDLLERAAFLKNRSRVVQQNIRQVDILEAELGMAEAELMLLETQEHYSAVKLALRR